MCKHEPDYTDANVSRLAAAPRAARFARFLGAILDWMETGIYFEPCKMTRVELSRAYVYIYMYILFTFHSRRVVFQVGETSTNPIFLSNGGV